jgi:hypothetical protein
MILHTGRIIAGSWHFPPEKTFKQRNQNISKKYGLPLTSWRKQLLFTLKENSNIKVEQEKPEILPYCDGKQTGFFAL